MKMKRYIAESLIQYVSEEKYPWHMPGHKRKSLWENGSGIQEMLKQAMQYDVTEVPGTDDLFCPTACIKESMNELRGVYGTAKSYYVVNGSTGAILTAIAACAKQNDVILVARNCHKSVYNAVQMLGLRPVYIEPENLYTDEVHPKLAGPVTVSHIRDAVAKLQRDENATKICAMVLTSPSYEGIVSDIAGIAEYLHKQDIKLIVDEAHGAHLPFICELPDSAVSLGADLVVQSLHKTMAALTQTALLHVCDASLIEVVERWMQVFMSSSPSYIFLCSMEEAVARACKTDTSSYIENLRGARSKIKELSSIHLLEVSGVLAQARGCLDETRLVLWKNHADGTRVSGMQFLRLLEEQGNIVVEMAGADYVVLISTMEDTKEDFIHLCDVLEMLDSMECGSYYDDTEDSEERFRQLIGKQAVDNIYVYPPGSYLITPGEVFTKEIVEQLIAYKQAGKAIRGKLL
ncbi:MAG: aminotransferase class I/II-fold pyridoxal phosphate-dependent enzyme [Eubacteriales bacterium]|nr:aminotransferase class I/II-fold pyridoxal phosphate-dependent enzyme [Lachnospiraceae bacterium]MDO5128197.1 aminotransferase class I/II-fold pyridoxal phosphate-dependent enzyme [Eubacteriales bacterium]